MIPLHRFGADCLGVACHRGEAISFTAERRKVVSSSREVSIWALSLYVQQDFCLKKKDQPMSLCLDALDQVVWNRVPKTQGHRFSRGVSYAPCLTSDESPAISAYWVHFSPKEAKALNTALLKVPPKSKIVSWKQRSSFLERRPHRSRFDWDYASGKHSSWRRRWVCNEGSGDDAGPCEISFT